MSEQSKPELFMFVWGKFCPDYTDGLAVAIAETVEQAKEMVRVNLFGPRYLDEDPSLGYFEREEAERLKWGPVQKFHVDQSVAFAVIGGG